MKLCDAFYAFFSPLLKNHLNKNDEIKKKTRGNIQVWEEGKQLGMLTPELLR